MNKGGKKHHKPHRRGGNVLGNLLAPAGLNQSLAAAGLLGLAMSGSRRSEEKKAVSRKKKSSRKGGDLTSLLTVAGLVTTAKALQRKGANRVDKPKKKNVKKHVSRKDGGKKGGAKKHKKAPRPHHKKD